MTQPENAVSPSASVEEIQQGWGELKLKVDQAAAERSTLEAENKALRFLLERLIEHRQRSHGDLVNFLADLVSKLSLNDVGLMVSKLVDHNADVCDACSAMLKGKAEELLPKPSLLKDLEAKKTALKEIGFKQRESGLIVQSLKALGKERITTEIIEKIRKQIKQEKYAKIRKETKTVTAWVYDAIKDICREG